MENLNKMLQSSTTTVGGMIEAVDVCIQSLNSLRNPDKFKEIFDLTEEFIESNDLDDIPVERQRKIPKRIDQGADNHRFASPEEKYRVEYYSVMDSTMQLLKQYFDSPDIREYKCMCDMLIKGSYNEEMCAKYPELNNGLQQELMFFHSQFKSKFSNLDECRILFQSLVPEIRMMFTQVEQLLRLLLQSPASSCSAERELFLSSRD